MTERKNISPPIRRMCASGQERVLVEDGRRVCVPPQWEFVPAGDPGLTRRLKATGDCWLVVARRRNRWESQGLWTDSERIAAIVAALTKERSSLSYQRKQAAAARSRAREQAAYTEEFEHAVLAYLHFSPVYADMAQKLARAVTLHAVPIGSGTVARTERIPVERRAEAAVIAWLRHQTTGYDDMKIAPVKGERREVRRRLAEKSRRLLEAYRRGETTASTACPLAAALAQLPDACGDSPGA